MGYAGEVIAMKAAKQVLLWHRQGKEEAAELKEIELQRKKRRGKSKLAVLQKKDADDGEDDGSSTFVKNKTLTMLVDENILDEFRHGVKLVYELPAGLTPTEMAMRINEKGTSIKNALTLRTTQLQSTGDVNAVKGVQNFEERYEQKISHEASDEKGGKKTNKKLKILKGKGIQDQTKGAAKSLRRGSVQWDNMETLKDASFKQSNDAGIHPLN